MTNNNKQSQCRFLNPKYMHHPLNVHVQLYARTINIYVKEIALSEMFWAGERSTLLKKIFGQGNTSLTTTVDVICVHNKNK